MKAKLYLADGTVLSGKAFGAQGETVGDLIFYTGMTGYQEMLTNPANSGKILAFTYPLIGNYGLSREDSEALTPWAQGIVVREYADYASNWRAVSDLDMFMKKHGIIGISGIDTRMLTRILRRRGRMKAVLTTNDKTAAELKERLNAEPEPADLVARVSTRHIQRIPGTRNGRNSGKRVVIIDYGCKMSIIQALIDRGVDLVIVPYDTPATEILDLGPDGVLLSNGPGDPKHLLSTAVPVIQQLLGTVPLFGIGLGHQVLALACGADTVRMISDHRGSQPVKDLLSGRSLITSQNHEYTVEPSSLAKSGLIVTHINPHDQSIEGLMHPKHPAFSVQFYPEASPGSQDCVDLFDRFLSMIEEVQEHPKGKRANAERKRSAASGDGDGKHTLLEGAGA